MNGERMFLIIGSGSLAVRLSRWCSESRRSVLVGLAATLPLDGPLAGCEVMALPKPMMLNELPLDAHKPTAVLFLDPDALSDSDPILALKKKWSNVPILTTMELEGDGIDLISVDDVSLSAMKDRIRSWEQKDGATVVQHYLQSVPKDSLVAIFCHDNPDPDALGAGLAMYEMIAEMGLRPELLHGGMIEHQQNRAMVRLLDIPVRRLILDWEVNDVLRDAAVIITLDFHRPGANNILPEDCVPHIVIDHHSLEESVAADISLVRPEFSATSSMVASLLMSLNHPITPRIATALAFGIRTDTLGFTRQFNAVDIRALSWLNAYVDDEMMKSIESPPRSQDTLECFAEALASRTMEQGILLAPLSKMPNRDALAQIADFLLPTEGVQTVVVFGPRRGKVILSARTIDPNLHLGRILSDTWGGGLSGGHKALAGGQIPFAHLVDSLPQDPDTAASMAVAAMQESLLHLFLGAE